MRNNLAIAILSLSLISCENTIGDTSINTINNAWPKDAQENFDINIEENSLRKNIFLVVRNNNDYPYSNLRLFVGLTNLKTKKTTVDTLNYILAKPNGEWIGNGFGNTKEILFQYKMDYLFPNPGKYRVSIKQAMRKDTLIGIEDVGVKIDNVKTK